MKMINRPLFIVAALVATIGCRNALPSEGHEVELAIVLPDATEIHQINWAIRSSGGAVIEMGAINTTSPKVTASLATDIPVGTGYTVTMSGMTTAGATCMGTSAPFEVKSGVPAMVSINIVCGSVTTEAGTGSVIVESTVVPGDSCPVLTSSLISPRVTGVGVPVDVMATASDADSGDTLTYAWMATGGSFTSASSASTQYHCPSTVGMQTLTLRISDNHTPTPCTTVVTFPAVDCE